MNQINSNILTSDNNQYNNKQVNLNNESLKQFGGLITENLNKAHENAVQENQFLNKTLDFDNNLLKNLQDDVERINKIILSLNEKNKELKDQILDTRRKINIERDNLTKTTSQIIQKTNEFSQNQSKIIFFTL